MLKKMIALMMVFSIFTGPAQASVQKGLKAAFDELSYSLNVEWDQKDPAFYMAQINAFTESMQNLKAQGLNNDQLIDFVKSEVKNEQIANDLEAAFRVIALNKMSAVEASNYMVATLENAYAQGASWNGSSDVLVGLTALSIFAVITTLGLVYCQKCFGYPM